MDQTNISLINSDYEYTPYIQRPETYIVPSLFFLIFVVGVIGNGTLVIVFLRHQAMRNVPNTYIFSLALADLLVIITCVPFTSIVYTMEYWPWGVVFCKISECAKDISIGVSVFTLTALSAERYCAIVKPLRRLQTHFAPDMWEITREDGSRKLKVHAVPTIFAFTIPRPKRKAPTKMELLLKRSAVSSISQAGNKPSKYFSN